MDILILSCGTGGGHNSAGHAVQEEMARRGHNTTFLNPYDLHSKKLAARIDNTYIGIAQAAPKLFGAIYTAGDLYRRLPCHSPVYWLNGGIAEEMAGYLEAHPFDAIFASHYFPTMILTKLRNQGVKVPKTIQIATDYTCSPFFEEAECDAYVIPSPVLTEEFVSRGIPADKIYPFGIPVRQEFQIRVPKNEAKRQLGLDPEKRYLLVAGGSIGAGAVEKTLTLLSEILQEKPELQVIAICGSNEKLYIKLKKLFGGSIRLYSHTDQMALFLHACDLYLTKPGGLSTSEAAVAGVPLALLPPIPGCESKNLRFFTQNGMGKEVDVSRRGLREIIALMDHQEACQKMIQQQKKWIQPDAAARVCDLAGADK